MSPKGSASAPCSSVTLRTSSAPVRLYLPGSGGYSVEAKTSFGHVSTELPITSTGELSGDSLAGKIGSGGCQVRLNNSNGNIEILKKWESRKGVPGEYEQFEHWIVAAGAPQGYPPRRMPPPGWGQGVPSPTPGSTTAGGLLACWSAWGGPKQSRQVIENMTSYNIWNQLGRGFFPSTPGRRPGNSRSENR
jgi:hypothetical protein